MFFNESLHDFFFSDRQLHKRSLSIDYIYQTTAVLQIVVTLGTMSKTEVLLLNYFLFSLNWFCHISGSG